MDEREVTEYNDMEDKNCVEEDFDETGSIKEVSDAEKLEDEEVAELIANVMKLPFDKIKNVNALKKGMTNRSFIFEYENKRYIMRIPGNGSKETVNREEEAAVYNVINDKDICDNIIYINPKTGYKITEYIENARNCDPLNQDDLRKCMNKLREFHNMKLKVGHTYDLFWYLEYYEKLWKGRSSMYPDYEETKRKVYELKDYIDEHAGEMSLTHIDPNYNNFLFSTDENGEEKLNLIDWEYAGMQDTDVDIAVFGTYAMYDKSQIDNIISLYFPEGCTKERRINIYCYVAIYGLCTSNWCEYKRHLGIDFGEYSLMQYKYAKEYYDIAKELMRN